MAFRAYTGLRASNSQLTLARNILRHPLPVTPQLSMPRRMETSAQVLSAQIAGAGWQV